MDNKVISYLIIAETENKRTYHSIDCLEEANKWRLENENKYKHLSRVYTLYMSSYDFLTGKDKCSVCFKKTPFTKMVITGEFEDRFCCNHCWRDMVEFGKINEDAFN